MEEKTEVISCRPHGNDQVVNNTYSVWAELVNHGTSVSFCPCTHEGIVLEAGTRGAADAGLGRLLVQRTGVLGAAVGKETATIALRAGGGILGRALGTRRARGREGTRDTACCWARTWFAVEDRPDANAARAGEGLGAEAAEATRACAVVLDQRGRLVALLL